MNLEILPLKTKKFLPPKSDLYAALEHLPKLAEGDVLVIASKILAIHQGRTIKVGDADKSLLIKKEADYHLPRHKVGGSDILLTIKDHVLIPSAGIDESNANGYYILWPKDATKEAKKIAGWLKKKHKIKNLAVVIVDSHTTPLRWGTSGIAIGFYGLEPLKDYRGEKDLFGRKLKYTQNNIVDALASLANVVMGEGKEQTPLVLIRGAKFVKFTNKDTYKKFIIPPKKDLYYPLLKIFKKNK